MSWLRRFIGWIGWKRRYDFYLAGPMHGCPNGNREEFMRAAKSLRSRGYRVWNPAEQNDKKSTFVSLMKKDLLSIINDCDGIALLPGSEESLGANAEMFVAYVCNKKFSHIVWSKDGIAFLRPKKFIDEAFVLPFNPGYVKFRTPREMIVPEEQVI